MIVDLFTSVAGCLNVKEFADGFIRKRITKNNWKRFFLSIILSRRLPLYLMAHDAFDCIADRNYCLYKHRRFKTVKPISPPHEEEPPRKKSKFVDG